MKRFLGVLTLTLLFASPRSAPAQTVSDVIAFLMTNQSVQTSDFERDRAASETARDTLTQALLSKGRAPAASCGCRAGACA